MATTAIPKCAIVKNGEIKSQLETTFDSSEPLRVGVTLGVVLIRCPLLFKSGVLAQHMGCAGFRAEPSTATP